MKKIINMLPTKFRNKILPLFVKQLNQKDSKLFWQQEIPEGNNPYDYLNASIRSEFLYQFKPKLPKDVKILEIGCNVGRNLNYFYKKGFRNLYGIEINPHALEVGRRYFYDLYKDCQIIQGEAQKIIKKFLNNEFDLVYSMAVLQHIPATSDQFFNDIAKKVKRYILTIEDETNFTERHFPRNYKDIFERYNFTQIKETINIPDQNGEFKGFVARLLSK